MTKLQERSLLIRRNKTVKRATISAVMAALIVSASTLPTRAQSTLEEPESFGSLALRCAPMIHPTTLAAVVRHESRANPYAIGVNTRGVRLARQPQSRPEAVATARLLLQRGINFDAGLGQINSRNFAPLGLSLDDLFEPCANLKAAGAVLADCYDRAASGRGSGQGALHAALSCYNTGSFSRGFRNGYVAKVAAQAGVPVELRTPKVHKRDESQVVALGEETEEKAPASSGAADAFGAPRRDAFSRKDQ